MSLKSNQNFGNQLLNNTAEDCPEGSKKVKLVNIAKHRLQVEGNKYIKMQQTLNSNLKDRVRFSHIPKSEMIKVEDCENEL